MPQDKELAEEVAGDVVDPEWLLAAYAAYLAEGHRATKPRRAVLGWIAATSAPFNAEVAVHELAQCFSNTSRATFYRMLDWLRCAGWLQRVYGDGGQHSYSRRRPGHQHTALCTMCGATLQLEGCLVEEIFARAVTVTGFEIRGHMLQLYGLCGACRAAQKAQRVDA